MKLGYLGPAGTYSEEAAHRYDAAAEMVALPSIPAVTAAVERGEVDRAVVPIENSLQGAVTDVLDFLIRTDTARIRHELAIPIDHCLLAAPGTRLADITVVYSHPQSLGQCRLYLEGTLSQARPFASLSNSSAVTDMLQNSGTAAAIAPRRAAEIYGAEILAEAIQDSPNNYTRFVVLAADDHPLTGRDKTSIAFWFDDDAPGLLYSVMGVFAGRGINLGKIESRPTGERLGRYVFLVDFDAHRSEPAGAESLAEARALTSGLKVFGSYPRMEALPVRTG